MKLATLTSLLLGASLVSAGTASAQPGNEAFEREMPTLDRSLAHPAPGPGLERAPDGPPRWCPHTRDRDIPWPSEIVRLLEIYRKGESRQDILLRVAAGTCRVDAPAYHHAATEVLQYWINETGLSAADAAASLAARLDTETWEAARKQLCSALLGDNNSRDAEVVAMNEARFNLFGCEGNPEDALWMKVRPPRLSQLYGHLDRGAMERDRDEIVRLAWVTSEIGHVFDSRESEDKLGAYAVDQYDIHELAYAQAVRQLDASPYKGNHFARTVLLETIGHARLAVARIEAAVAKRAQDRRWKDLLLTVPQRAAAAWLEAADRHRDALARSDAIAAAIAARDDAAHGCEAKLRADIAPIVRQLAHGASSDVEDRLAGDPLLGLLIRRLAVCLEFEGDAGPASALDELASHLGILQGPRAAAHTATDAAAAAMRRGAPFSASDVMPDLDPAARRQPGRTHAPFGTIVIQSMTPVGKRGAVKLTFPRERYQYTKQDCKETNKVDRIRPDGTVVYRTVCRDLGKAWAENVPEPIVVPASCKAGLAVGRYIGEDHGVPVEVFADKARKHLLALACLALP